MSNLFLALCSVLIWGTTWFIIKFQLGSIDPLWSVAYRFLLASVMLFAICSYKKISWKIDQHGLVFLLGIFLFGINYWLAYLSEIHVTSALTAVVYSVMVFMNIFNARWLLKTPINHKIVLAAILGVGGIFLIYKSELAISKDALQVLWGVLFALSSAYFASLGNILAIKIKNKHINVLQANAWGMFYGALAMAILALLLQRPISFSLAPAYLFSLSYLAIFGSVIAFSAYLTLCGRIGPGKAAYVTLFVPVVSLLVSTCFESYHWTIFTVSGISLLLVGNYLALRK